MSNPDIARKRTVERISVRRHVNRKIIRFSLSIGAVAAVLTVVAYGASTYPSVRRWEEINLRTLSEINCDGAICDTSRFTTDWQAGGPDYVIDMQTRYFINVPEPSVEGPARFVPLDYSDIEFIGRFRRPASYTAPDGEIWRLYSRQADVGDKKFEIVVGYAEKAPWKMLETPHSMMGDVDATLKREADKIATSVPTRKLTVRGPRAAFSASADGFEVVDASTGQVLDWGPWLPVFLPKGNRLPSPGRELYLEGGDLYIAQTDTNGRLVATSLVRVGNLWWLSVLAGFALVSTSVIARALSRRFLRRYFALTRIMVPSLEEALRRGEGQSIEFKRGLSADEGKAGNAEDELLRSIAAFANTNDGVIFIGVDDGGHVKGLGLDFKQRDRLERKVHQLVRNRVSPVPPVQVMFEDVRGLMVAKVTVSRGEALAHMLGGVIYVREGSTDVQAQAEDLRRLVTEYAA